MVFWLSLRHECLHFFVRINRERMDNLAPLLASIPKFTLVYCGTVLIFATLISIGFVQPASICFDLYSVVMKLQLHRIITSPFLIGKLDLTMLMFVLTVGRSLSTLESRHFAKRTSNLVFIFIMLTLVSQAVAVCLGGMFQFFIGPLVENGLIFIYSKIFASEQTMYFGIIPMNMQFLPYMNIVYAALSKNPILLPIIGIFIGHFVYYILFILPAMIGKPIFKCPKALSKLLDPTNPAEFGEAPIMHVGVGHRLG